MNKQEFLAALKAELAFISVEEREDAIKYYEEYFDDAGEENEASIISELVTPKKLAEKILGDLGYTKEGLRKTDNGNIELKLIENLDEIEKLQEIENIIKDEKKADLNDNKTASDNISVKETVSQKPPEQSEKNNSGQKHTSSNKLLVVALLILSSPIWAPIFFGMIAVIIGLFCAFFAASLSFFAAAVSGFAVMLTGIGLLVYGVVTLFTNIFIAIVMIGQGFLCLGIGMIVGYIFFRLAIFLFKWQFKITAKLFGIITGALYNLFSGKRNYNAA